MKSPELTKSEGKKIDAFLESNAVLELKAQRVGDSRPSMFELMKSQKQDRQIKEGHAKEMIETILFGDHRTLKEILKL